MSKGAPLEMFDRAIACFDAAARGFEKAGLRKESEQMRLLAERLGKMRDA